MHLNPAEKNALHAIKSLLDIVQVRATTKGLREAFWQHPDFPNLNVLSEILTELGVPNLATRLSPDQLFDIPLPALAYLQVDGGVFVPVRQIGTTIEWQHTQRGWQKDSFNEFVQKWNGVMLLIEPQATSGERNYTHNRKIELLNNLRIPFVVLVLGVCMGLLVYQLISQYHLGTNWLYYALLLTKTIGTILGTMLVWYSMDSQNTLLKSICNINDSTNCSNILSSPSAKVFSWLSWSEVGLFYFTGGLIYLLVIPFIYRFPNDSLESHIGSLGILTILALPYTFWSVWYQWRVARQWCILCMTVQVLLWVEFSLFLYSTHYSYWTENSSLLNIGLWVAFLVVPAIWVLLKPQIQKALHYDKLFREFQKLKFSSVVLKSLLNQKQQLPPIYEGMEVIELGKPEAEHTLIVVSNPSCAGCRRDHLDLEKLLATTPNLRCQIIMAANPQDEAGKVALHLLSLPVADRANALHSWFEKEGNQYCYWKNKYEGNPNVPQAIQQLDIHLQWIRIAGIQTAPVKFLNEVELPAIYRIAELPKLLAVLPHNGFAQINHISI